ncbi:Stk1 family PASTA domain-containing Ser/Thr kinase [Paenarthrobacter ureafaciens]|uniref:Stk1 family PASTA domain-containing Ser/Thr kinase n=1 Tax=Paenarthrobacter ureafaciens TaxID=37931 RepID=UPI001917027D|nr:Stk1 family PASTA domain-containing Ser/Thr kinase [Paenarthrobacter ureafaciens]QQQ62331.1 Stk1 family PASTA domain-containing Ser/Thr kinase [Paenarthrobacter ureafaciens]UOD81353.1 Stk1 family PASTA domain-containing Ser/Thr kinase [Paenarthrobacter ureafaciens]WNZ04006.1 Stk1 family PASTA domain-containing Ser/Thr kinase [Paenarthrobacter ureafaciens]
MTSSRQGPAHREEGTPVSEQRILNGRYELGELIGRGGMADVYRGTDTLLGRTIAVKVLRADLARDPQFQARFKREAQAVAALNHASIVAIFDTGEYSIPGGPGEDVRVPYIVMEFVAGRTLRDMIKAKELTVEGSIGYTLGVLSALEYSHRAGIVHRDIKPANVMVCADTGEVKVMDFGIARAMADSSATMTQTQAVVGTAQYLSPEQARGETVDARSDLYSAGCLLYELLTGRPPFVGDSPVSVAYQHVRETPDKASIHNPEVSEALDSVLAKALQKNRDDRFQDAAAFRRALRAASNGVPVPAVPASEAPTDPNDLVDDDNPSTQLLSATAVGFLNVDQINDDPEHADYAEPQGYALRQADDDLPLGLPPERERTARQKSRRRAWAATLAIFTILVLAGAGFWIYSVVNAAPPAPAKVAVPAVANMSESQALQELYGAKLVPKTTRVASDTVAKDMAIGTSPDAGAMLEQNAEVVLNISSGPSSVTIPKDIAGRTESDARDYLKRLGITGAISTVRTHSPTVPFGLVITTGPAPGAPIAAGSNVELQVSSGRVLMPQLAGLTQAEAEALLKENGLLMAVVEQENTQVEPGKVTAQSDAANTEVEQGKTITVTLAKAPAPEPTPTPKPTETDKPKPTPTKKD